MLFYLYDDFLLGPEGNDYWDGEWGQGTFASTWIG